MATGEVAPALDSELVDGNLPSRLSEGEETAGVEPGRVSIH